MSEEYLETYECAGCGGDVVNIEALFLPQPIAEYDHPMAKPYCSQICFETNAADQQEGGQEKRNGNA